MVQSTLLTLLSNLQTTENMSPPNRLASQRFLIMASLKQSHTNSASILVWTARPIPSNTIRSTVNSSLANSRPSRLKQYVAIKQTQYPIVVAVAKLF